MGSYKGARSYSWAKQVPKAHENRLSGDGRTGLALALELAKNAAERGSGTLPGEALPFKLTPAELAKQEGLSPVTLHELIKLACLELFRTTAAPDQESKRNRQLRRHKQNGVRFCEIGGCGDLLPLYARRSRTRCDSCQAKDRRRRGNAEPA